MPEQKKRITFDEFIDEQMLSYTELVKRSGDNSCKELLKELREILLTSVWSRDDAANDLAENGRELIADKVEQEPIKCKSCNEILYQLTLKKYHVDTFRVTCDLNNLHMKFEHQEKEPELFAAQCTKCGAGFDLSDFEIHYNK